MEHFLLKIMITVLYARNSLMWASLSLKMWISYPQCCKWTYRSDLYHVKPLFYVDWFPPKSNWRVVSVLSFMMLNHRKSCSLWVSYEVCHQAAMVPFSPLPSTHREKWPSHQCGQGSHNYLETGKTLNFAHSCSR